MANVYKNGYFNPGGLYADGVVAAKRVSESRKEVAKLIGTTSDHVIFTRGGTESCNLAVLGILRKLQTPPSSSRPSDATSPLQGEDSALPHVIVSAIEHAAVLETVKDLEKKGEIELSISPVNSDGFVDMDELKKLLKPTTVLVSVMYVNNEIGTVQPIKEIAKLLRWYKKQNSLKDYPLFHTDAIQAANYLDINVEKLGVDLMSLSGSKIYGPKSSGILYVRNKELIAPILHGGEQEMGLRAGTEDVVQVVGFAKALHIARKVSESESVRLAGLQTYFFDELRKNINRVKINGSTSERIPNNINISIPGISGERIIIELDARGIAASSKSACREDVDEESHVIAALRKGKSSSTEGSVRFTMGRGTTKKSVERVVGELAKIVNKIKSFEKELHK